MKEKLSDEIQLIVEDIKRMQEGIDRDTKDKVKQVLEATGTEVDKSFGLK